LVIKENPDGCEIEFMVDFKFKSIFLQTLMETLFNEAVKKMVKAFESRANQLYS
jgi:Oligoketide cyclase/lipid transport protein